jgi:hypothetical protein
MIDNIQNFSLQQTFTPNPASILHVFDLAKLIRSKLPPKPRWLADMTCNCGFELSGDYSIVNQNPCGNASAFCNCLGRNPVVAIGGPTSVFQLVNTLSGLTTFTASDVWQQLLRCVNQSDEMLRGLGASDVTDEPSNLEQKSYLRGLPQPEMVVPKLVLVFTVMQTLGLAKIEFAPANGSTSGVSMLFFFVCDMLFLFLYCYLHSCALSNHSNYFLSR